MKPFSGHVEDAVLDDLRRTYLDFPKELIHVPREIGETRFTVERWETPERGGHFPALEQTERLADSVRRFSRSPRS